ncbi:dTDP-glucose 4,6-dehydratase [Candidatus Synechococcus calcipolaris G9]|uniref:dTDP-glucose 4,6-dehydratase n=1 Tax=Candidatus Synechococcus calcipolaris G9 TaxID=1497997 RepID=A0ABT6F3L5_9SYNE|nr:dTDP-glucose 4,6-dehydratase [Candidatus Synechococcus calcipolaris]MDG2992417.1 dTDP-glucose 4,6-dehydratase [Candidatus Synechococcus calcipolaris G9]
MSVDTPIYLVTGGAGFIGSNFVLLARQKQWAKIINLDKLTYAANVSNLASLTTDSEYSFIKGNIGDTQLLFHLFEQYQPDAVINFAAESHVDRSILEPDAFIQTNIMGTFRLLEASLSYWQGLPTTQQATFRFLHVSTDEVYGSLNPEDLPFTENSPYAPNSPYAASKAGADHLVRAYHHTYGLPTLTTNCSNNYGPYQFPEKLIPLMVLNALDGHPLPLYGDGQNIRDWLYVTDHCEALYCILCAGQPGSIYAIGGKMELTNQFMVETICDLLDELVPNPKVPYRSLITYVKDRPGHDRRYAIDCSKLESELGWSPQETFNSGIRKTIQWYLDHPQWVQQVRSGAYQTWMDKNYGDR